MEISQGVDQRRQRIVAFIETHAEQLARQGAVVAAYRLRDGRVVGPGYRLSFRLGQVRRSVYLGAKLELIAEVRKVLEELQKPWRKRRALALLKKGIFAAPDGVPSRAATGTGAVGPAAAVIQGPRSVGAVYEREIYMTLAPIRT